jgi:hypothetical protein
MPSGGQEGRKEMVDRPYHDYSTSALRELGRDLASSQAQLNDQRADYIEVAGSDHDELRRLDVLIDELGRKLAAIDRELDTRHRERTAVPASARRGVTRHAASGRTHSQRVMPAEAKPHFRAKGTPVA